nr:hypothetical protein [Marinicella sp. W31]MDC2876210.1 hypothetical protein [Marinicella sp. W31]
MQDRQQAGQARGYAQNGVAQGGNGTGWTAMRNNDPGNYGPGTMNGRQGGPQGDFGPGGMRGTGNGTRGNGPAMMGELGAFDANNDGFLSLDRFEAFQVEVGRPMFARHFQYLDTDGDGKVAVSELSVMGTGPQQPGGQGPAGNQRQPQMPRSMGNFNN